MYKNHLYYTTKHIQGYSLTSSRLKASPLSFDSITQLFSTLTHGVQKLHDNNIYHQNLYSENIIIDHSGSPHIINTFFPHYNSNKHNEYSNYLEHTSPALQDQGMLSLLFLQLLANKHITLQLPLHEENISDFLPDNISDNLKSVCVHAFPYQNKKTYASCGEFSKDLKTFLEGELTVAYTGVSKSTQFIRNNYILLGTIGSLLLLSSSLAFYYQAKNNEYLALIKSLTTKQQELTADTSQLKQQEYNLVLKNTLESISLSISKNVVPKEVNIVSRGDEIFKKLTSHKELAVQAYREWSNLYRIFALQATSFKDYKHFLYVAIKIGKEGLIRYPDKQLFDDVLCNASFLLEHPGETEIKRIIEMYPHKHEPWYTALTSSNSSTIQAYINQDKDFKFLYYHLIHTLISEGSYQKALEITEENSHAFRDVSLLYMLQGQLHELLAEHHGYGYITASSSLESIEYNFMAASRAYQEAFYYNKFRHDALLYYIDLQNKTKGFKSLKQKQYRNNLSTTTTYFKQYYTEEMDDHYEKKILIKMMKIYNMQKEYHESIKIFNQLKKLYPHGDIEKYYITHLKKDKEFLSCFPTLVDTYNSLGHYTKELEVCQYILQVINKRINYHTKQKDKMSAKKQLLLKNYYKLRIEQLQKKKINIVILILNAFLKQFITFIS